MGACARALLPERDAEHDPERRAQIAGDQSQAEDGAAHAVRVDAGLALEMSQEVLVTHLRS